MPEIDTASIRRRMASGEIRNPTEVVFAVLAEVDRLRAENTALAAAIADIEGDVRAGHGNRLTAPT